MTQRAHGRGKRARLAILFVLIPSFLFAADVQNGSSGDWPMHGHDAAETRFSPLTQINRDTVGRLGLAWAYATGDTRGMEATPIVIDGVMYVSTAWSRVVALDATTGQRLWQFDPQVDGAKGRDACCDVVNRGVAVLDDQVFIGVLDGRLIALDRHTGKQNWSVQTTDTQKPYTITGAPRIAKGRVIIGNGGAEFGVRGYFSAYDARTGDLVWRFHTVPSQDVAEDEQQPSLRKARATWPQDALWESGLGGTVWDSFAFDAGLNLVYAGVGNAAQYNRAVRSPGGGDNLFISSIVAVDADTGEYRWHYQTTPADSWDYTATQHMILTELDILGARRKVILQAPKNGFFYVLDRATGELLSADKYVHVNWASHVDPETGKPVETPVADWSRETRMISPSIVGGHNWHPMAFSPMTRLVYIPTVHNVYQFQANPDFRYDPRTMNTGEDMAGLQRGMPSFRPSFCSPTRLTAWDPVAQRPAWEVPFASNVSAGILSTAGGLVFQGTTDGELVAYRDDTGEKLWAQPVHVGIMAPPVSYRVGDVQYVAVVAGIGGSQGGHFVTMANENPGHVFAFRLDGTAVPPSPPPRRREVHVDPAMLDEASAEHGGDLYATHCLRCHGVKARSSGLVPDLRFSAAHVHAIWQQIVRDGVFASRGMAGFADSLSAADVNAIHSYVIREALASQSLTGRVLDSLGQQVCIPAEWLAD